MSLEKNIGLEINFPDVDWKLLRSRYFCVQKLAEFFTKAALSQL